MDRKKGWKDFQTLVDEGPDYRALMYCEDPEEKALRLEFLELRQRLSACAAWVHPTPKSSRTDDAYLSQVSARIDQRLAIDLFLETLFETGLRQDGTKTLNLLFAFLETYTALLKKEAKWS